MGRKQGESQLGRLSLAVTEGDTKQLQEGDLQKEEAAPRTEGGLQSVQDGLIWSELSAVLSNGQAPQLSSSRWEIQKPNSR